MIINFVRDADRELVEEIERLEASRELVRGSEIFNTPTDKSECMYHMIVFGVKEPQQATYTKLMDLMESIVDGQHVDRGPLRTTRHLRPAILQAKRFLTM